MNKRFLVVILAGLIILPVAIFGCKGKVEKEQAPDTSMAMPEAMSTSQEALMPPEPAQIVATETIPPSASPQIAGTPTAQEVVSQAAGNRVKDIQTALKNAGFYTGAIDGKLGPKTRKAIEEFQAAKGLKVDGKVGPKTWAELDKYLTQ